MDMQELFGEVIHSYSREQALEDGVLVDVSIVAGEAGFKFPVAITAGVLADIRSIPAAKIGWEDEEGRLWDLLWMAMLAARRGGSEPILYQFHMKLAGSRKTLYTAKLAIGPGDNMEPVITILRPDED